MIEHPPYYWISMAIFASPSIPAAVSAKKLLNRRENLTSNTTLPLGIILGSLIFMFSGGMHPAIWGPDYSNLRFRIIGSNFVLSLLASLIAVTARPKWQTWTLAAALMLAAIWAFVYAINSVV